MRFSHKLLLLPLIVVAFGDVLFAQNDQANPDESYSSSRRYSVKIVHAALPGTDQYTDFFTIEMLREEQVISKFPTIGHLASAYWSPDGKYVAVNNRRANSGDYLWVFRLSDGHAIKKPVDAGAKDSDDPYDRFERKLVGHITTAYPKQTYDAYRKEFTFTTGWTDKGELNVINDVQFNNLEILVIQVFERFTVKGDTLRLVQRQIGTRPRDKGEF